MYPLGLSATDLAAFNATLNESHTYQLDVDVLTLEHAPASSIQPYVLDGQVNLSDDGEVTRTLQVSFSDPNRSLQLDSDSPADGALYADRMIRVAALIRVPELDRSVRVPVFCGPLVKFDRAADVVTVEGQGKEMLARTGVPTLTLKRGMRTVDAIKSILRDRCGETKFAFPTNVRARLPRNVVVSWEDEAWPWKVCLWLARSVGHQLFYDGAGICRLRPWSYDPLIEWVADDEDANITQAVQVTNDFTQIRNRVIVVGSKPAHSAVAIAAASHPLSPTKLGRNGIRRYLSLQYDDSAIASKRQAQLVANRELANYLTMGVGVTFNAVPAWHVDVLDMCRVTTADFSADFRLRNASLPLGTSGDMSIGYQTRVSKPRRRARLV